MSLDCELCELSLCSCLLRVCEQSNWMMGNKILCLGRMGTSPRKLQMAGPLLLFVINNKLKVITDNCSILVSCRETNDSVD